jgi:hypothetical protein
MHFEVPKAKTFKEFGGEYLMIVISILTALALEQGLEALHHRHLAHQASEKMDAELRDTIKQVTQSLEHNETKARELHQVREQLLAGIQARTGDAELMKRYEQEWKPMMRLNMDTPSLHREAWEAAVANQAVTWMRREDLERYAGAYGAIRDVGTVTYGGAMMFLNVPQMMNVFSDAQMGVSNPRDLYRVATQMVSVYDNLDYNLKTLNALLKKAVDEQGSAHAAKPEH